MKKKAPLRDIDEILEHTTQADFAGLGSFHSLTPAERLEWLDEAARLAEEIRGLASPSSPTRTPT